MRTRAFVLALAMAALGAPSSAQAPAQGRGGSPDPGVTPTTVVDRAEVRVLRVELQAGATRRVHQHDDVEFHLFMPITGPVDLNIPGDATQSATSETVEPWHLHLFKKGTPHGFTNKGKTAVLVAEIFVKGGAGAALLNQDEAIVLALAAAR